MNIKWVWGLAGDCLETRRTDKKFSINLSICPIFHQFSISHEIWTQFCCVVFCCVVVWLYHQLLWFMWYIYPYQSGFFTCTGTTLWLLQWRHNGLDSISNHQHHDCLLKHLFRHRLKKTQSSTSLAFVRGIHRRPVNSPHKGPVTRKIFPSDDVIMLWLPQCLWINFHAMWPSDVARLHHRSGPTLFQVMAWCHQAPSHYLNQCWHIMKAILGHSPESNFTRSSHELNL